MYYNNLSTQYKDILHLLLLLGKKKYKPQGLAQLVRRVHTLSVRGEVTGSSLESFGVRPSARMVGGLPPLPSTNVGKYCCISCNIIKNYSPHSNSSFTFLALFPKKIKTLIRVHVTSLCAMNYSSSS